MSSSINPNNIDGQYPVAGQDNDSQGFRDNFTNIRNNLSFAKTELEDLQSKVLLKSALAGTTLDNEMSNAQLKGVQCLRFTETLNDLGPLSGTVNVDWQDAHYQTLETAGTVTLDFTGWPDDGTFTKLRLDIDVTSVAHTVEFPADVTIGVDRLQGASGQVVTFAAIGRYQFEFSTFDSATDITVVDLSRNYNSGTMTDLTVNNNLNIGGNVIVSGYDYTVPSTDFNLTANVDVSRVIFRPSGTLAKGTLTLPAGNVDAKVVTVSSTADITAFAIKGYGNVTVVPSANVTLTAGTSVEYFYHASEWKWYKVR